MCTSAGKLHYLRMSGPSSDAPNPELGQSRHQKWAVIRFCTERTDVLKKISRESNGWSYMIGPLWTLRNNIIIITNSSIHQFEFHLTWENPFKLLTRHTYAYFVGSSSFSCWSSQAAPDLSLSTWLTVTQNTATRSA
jgi:hypothetical protein